ncbi:MAG: Uma2 family endonuclease, partial [Spirulinaceae cyanobacterium]
MTSSSNLPTQSDPPLPPWQTLPTMYDLPSEYVGDSGLPDEFHIWQTELLKFTFKPQNYPQERVFTAVDLNLYYDVTNTLWYKRPDWFAVVGIPRLYEGHDLRLSYVIWQERVSPMVAVELLSPGTEDEDLGRTVAQAGKPPTKWQVYEQILRVPYYFVFSRYTNQLQAFHLVGAHYEPMSSIEGRWLIPELHLSLSLWQGSYEGVERLWLRWMSAEG